MGLIPHGAVGPSTLSGEGPGAPAVDTLNNLFYEYLNLNGAVVPEFPPQTRPYLKMAIPCFLELEEVAAKSFSVLWGGKGRRKCVSSGAGAFHSSVPAHISCTSFINERPLPGLSTKCCFWGSKWPVHYSCTKMCSFTQTLQTNGHFQLKCVFVIETLSTNGNFQDCLRSSNWPALYI